MLEDIKLGQKVHITVAKQPTNAAAKKTIARVLAKDPAIAREKQRREDVRREHKHFRTRAGRPWMVRPAKKPVVQGDRGDAGTVTVRYQELLDLKSVARFVEVKAG